MKRPSIDAQLKAVRYARNYVPADTWRVLVVVIDTLLEVKKQREQAVPHIAALTNLVRQKAGRK